MPLASSTKEYVAETHADGSWRGVTFQIQRDTHRYEDDALNTPAQSIIVPMLVT
jgi:hypothetical protein